jgi:hypothetical protein
VEVASLSDDCPCAPSPQFAVAAAMTVVSRVEHEALVPQALLPVQALVQVQALLPM